MAIGEEKYHPPLDSETGEVVPGDHGKHQHVFMKTQEKWLLVEVREHLVLFTDGEYSIDMQTCRSPKSWIIYLSKNDTHPFLHKVRVSELSLFARAWHHAKTTYQTPRPINRQDEFIVSCGQNARFALRICEEHVQNLRQEKANNRPLYAPNVMCNLVNDILVALESSDHIYIYGEPGLGKTEIVDWFLRGKKYWKAGEPSNFLFYTLTDQVDYIWFEDFKLDKYLPYLSTLLSIMHKKEVKISRKGIDDCTKMIFAKFIYCSNYEIDDLYPMFKRRLD